jgi:hypothetical protein
MLTHSYFDSLFCLVLFPFLKFHVMKIWLLSPTTSMVNLQVQHSRVSKSFTGCVEPRHSRHVTQTSSRRPSIPSGPTRGGQENCVVNGAVSGSALPSVVPTTVGLVEGDRTTIFEPVMLSLTATARVRCKKQEDNIPWSGPKFPAHQRFKTITPQQPLVVIL